MKEQPCSGLWRWQSFCCAQPTTTTQEPGKPGLTEQMTADLTQRENMPAASHQ